MSLAAGAKKSSLGIAMSCSNVRYAFGGRTSLAAGVVKTLRLLRNSIFRPLRRAQRTRVDPNLATFGRWPGGMESLTGEGSSLRLRSLQEDDCMIWTSSSLSYGVRSGKHTRITGLSDRGANPDFPSEPRPKKHIQ